MKLLYSGRARLSVVALGLAVQMVGSFARGAAAPGRAAIDEGLRAAVERRDVPGVLAMAADRHGVIYQGAAGLAESQGSRALTMDAIFRIASMTKAVTSVALMQLVAEGRVALDDPAEKYFPALAHPMVFESFDAATHAYLLRPARTAITVRHLLTHTSGLGYPFTSAILRDFKPKEGEQYPAGPLLFEPGTQWLYGTGIDWAGRLVEKLSGRTLEEYFRERIFAPLGMADTFFSVPEEKWARVVNVHDRLPNGSFQERARPALTPVTTYNGGGGLYSTAGDYIRFLRMLLNGGELDGEKILSKDAVAQMSQNHIGAVNVRALQSALPLQSADFTFVADGHDKWGIGFLITTDHVAGKRSAGSMSWGGINNTYFWWDPTRGVAGVILMQFYPFADPKALGVYDAFERGVYQLAGAR